MEKLDNTQNCVEKTIYTDGHTLVGSINTTTSTYLLYHWCDGEHDTNGGSAYTDRAQKLMISSLQKSEFTTV